MRAQQQIQTKKEAATEKKQFRKEPDDFPSPNFSDRRASTVAQYRLNGMANRAAQARSLPSSPTTNHVRPSPQHPQEIIQREKMGGSTLDGHTSDVEWETDTLGGAKVGVEMTANPIGPDHPQGGPPRYGEQASLMNQLHTDPKSAGEDKYIRGHLLNDNIGGEGKGYNLYPLTGIANKEHHDRIEDQVKSWVNIDKQWVNYHVKVNDLGSDLDNDDIQDNYVDAEFVCEASVLDPKDMKTKVKTVSATIKSESGVVNHEDEEWENQDAILPPKGVQADLHAPPLSSAKKTKNYKFDDNLFKSIQELYNQAYLDQAKDLFKEIGKISGIAEFTIGHYKTLITEAFENDNAFDDELPKEEKSALTKINNNAGDIIAEIKKFILWFEQKEDDESEYSQDSSESSSDDENDDAPLSVALQLEKISDDEETWNQEDWNNLKQTVYGTTAGSGEVNTIIEAIDKYLSGNTYYAAYRETFEFLLAQKFK